MRSISRLLFVAEGRLHPHKLLGLYAICHFAYRYHAFFANDLSADMGFAGGKPHRTALALAPRHGQSAPMAASSALPGRDRPIDRPMHPATASAARVSRLQSRPFHRV